MGARGNDGSKAAAEPAGQVDPAAAAGGGDGDDDEQTLTYLARADSGPLIVPGSAATISPGELSTALVVIGDDAEVPDFNLFERAAREEGILPKLEPRR